MTTTVEKSISAKALLPFEETMKVVSQVDNLWKIHVTFPPEKASQQHIIGRLRDIKAALSRKYTVPAVLLEFRDLIDKKTTIQGIEATVIVGLREVPQGKPEVRLRPLETARGELIPDMIAELDFYYLDEFDHPISMKRLLLEIEKAGVDLEMCDLKLLEQHFKKVTNDNSYVKKLEIARGELPSIGEDAELEYAFFTDPNLAEDISEYRTGRKVQERDILCQKIPPKNGKQPGRDVHGEIIPPIQGLDFELVADEGAKLSLDGTTVVALRDGSPHMERIIKKIYTLAGEKVVPVKIEVSVKTIIALRGDEVMDIVLQEPVEIFGDLREGSSVSTDGEIFVTGGVQKGTKLNARDNVLISGLVEGGEINSEKNVFFNDDVHDARISAGELINVKGLISNSDISGRDVILEEVEGSTIQAGRKVTIQKVKSSSDGRRTKIKVGRQDFYSRRMELNKQDITTIEANLDQIRRIFGGDVIEQLNEGQYHHVLVQHIKKLSRTGVRQIDNKTIESYRRLLESFRPMRKVIDEKSEEIKHLRVRSKKEKDSRPIIIFREKMQAPVDIVSGDKKTTVETSDTGKAVTTDKDGNFKQYDMKPSSKQKQRENELEEAVESLKEDNS
ncbi:FapA family protein [bacterium]|nr:FapA family protein [bacterium]